MGYREQLVTSKLKLVSTSNKLELTSYEVQTRALTIAAGLTSTVEPADMTAWYCKAYRVLGEGKYTALASMARTAKCDPKKNQSQKKLFGWLLKQELNKRNGQISTNR